MADKEVTSFVIDVDSSMGTKHGGRQVTDLQYGLNYVKDVVASKIIKGRKTDLVSLVTVNCDESKNEAGLDHVKVHSTFKQPFFSDLKEFDVQSNLKPLEDDDRSGIVRALLLSIQNMNNFVKKLKYKKNIVLVTNSRITPELDEEYSNAIVELINNSNINLVLIGVDFHDDTEIEDFKRNIQSWELLFKSIPNSTLMTGKQANEVVDYPNPKTVRPVKTFSGEFRIGANLLDKDFNSRDDLSCVCFNVDGYPATKIDRPPSRKTYALNNQDEPEPISISNEYEIHLYTNDFDNENELQNADEEDLESRPFEIQPIEKDQLVKGYKYGKNTVVLPPALEEKRKYTTEPGIDIRGVVSQDKIPRCYLTSESTIILGSKQKEADTRALGAFVDALTEMDSFALARYVAKKNSEVQMVVLIPVYIKKNGGVSNKRKADDENLDDIRGLILSRLPFYEDEKIASFPSLTEVITTSGKTITENHKLLPTDEVQDLMDDLVTTMDLDSTQETDFDGKKRVFNPLTADTLLPLPTSLGNHDNLVKRATGIHRVNLALKNIAVNGASYEGGLKSYLEKDDIIPNLSEPLQRETVPDPKVLERVEHQLLKLSKLLQVSYIAKTHKPRRNVDEIQAKEEEEDDISLEELLSRGVRT